MATVNVPNRTAARSTLRTHEGAPAKRIDYKQQLSRILMACLLWEDQFYVDGKTVASQITELVKELTPEDLVELTIKAHEEQKLRHAPLWVIREMARGTVEQRKEVAELIERTCKSRPDQLTELLALYWKDKKQPLSAQIRKGIAKTFPYYSAYQLAKYNRDGAVKLKDVLFLGHPKPKDDEQYTTWKKLIDGTLESPDTWEVNLSAGKDKKETFTRLIQEKKLGALALLRNLRNMIQAGVDDDLIRQALNEIKVEKVLPFRFIAAARYAPRFEPELEKAMLKCLANHEKLSGKTLLLVDVSGSMDSTVSGKSEISRLDAANGVAMLLREIAEDVTVWTFSNKTIEVPSRRGFALRDAITNSQVHSGTYLGQAIKDTAHLKYDRIIVITDEQSHDSVSGPPLGRKGYLVNVAAYKNGVGYGKWNHIDGWSESVVTYIQNLEKDGLNV